MHTACCAVVQPAPWLRPFLGAMRCMFGLLLRFQRKAAPRWGLHLQLHIANALQHFKALCGRLHDVSAYRFSMPLAVTDALLCMAVQVAHASTHQLGGCGAVACRCAAPPAGLSCTGPGLMRGLHSPCIPDPSCTKVQPARQSPATALAVPPRSLAFSSAAPALAIHRPLHSGCSEPACKAVTAPCGNPAPSSRCKARQEGAHADPKDAVRLLAAATRRPERSCVCTCGPAAQQRKLGAPSCWEMIGMRLTDVCCARRRCRRELASHRRRSP